VKAIEPRIATCYRCTPAAADVLWATWKEMSSPPASNGKVRIARVTEASIGAPHDLAADLSLAGVLPSALARPAVDQLGNVLTLWSQESVDAGSSRLMSARYRAATDDWSEPVMLVEGPDASFWYADLTSNRETGAAVAGWSEVVQEAFGFDFNWAVQTRRFD
jgi:hypothetical protein